MRTILHRSRNAKAYPKHAPKVGSRFSRVDRFNSAPRGSCTAIPLEFATDLSILAVNEPNSKPYDNHENNYRFLLLWRSG